MEKLREQTIQKQRFFARHNVLTSMLPQGKNMSALNAIFKIEENWNEL